MTIKDAACRGSVAFIMKASGIRRESARKVQGGCKEGSQVMVQTCPTCVFTAQPYFSDLIASHTMNYQYPIHVCLFMHPKLSTLQTCIGLLRLQLDTNQYARRCKGAAPLAIGNMRIFHKMMPAEQCSVSIGSRICKKIDAHHHFTHAHVMQL